MTPAKATKQSGRKSFKLAILTFLAVGGITTLVGLIVVPIIIKKVESVHLMGQSDRNERQARSLAIYAERQFKKGIYQGEISDTLQAILTGANTERGYSCIVDRADSSLVCHPPRRSRWQTSPAGRDSVSILQRKSHC